MDQEKRMRFLAIDDDDINNYICEQLINHTGNAKSFTSCNSGVHALDYLDSCNSNKPEELPDIILLDINLPIMNGWQFLDAYQEELGNLKKDIKIYMLTSAVYGENFEKAKQHPRVSGFIMKPLSCEKLKELTGKENKNLSYY
ncbi:response regulator [Flexithrix dorotheae]|uniref:response regulator n=1 Tax=Flexithrix dorotheae TaxID=70993 RepID=UPI00037BB74C|nr:response regulator [Flexithrix dorotheae]